MPVVNMTNRVVEGMGRGNNTPIRVSGVTFFKTGATPFADGDFDTMAPPGALGQNGAGVVYMNTGTQAATVWTPV